MEKFTNGGILSGLIIKDEEGATVPDHVWCVYGKKGSPLNMMKLTMKRNEATGGKRDLAT